MFFLLVCRWLDAACDPADVRAAHPDYSAIKIAQLIDQAKEARLCLKESAKSRDRFWRMLLVEAGLQHSLQSRDF